jgi:tetratricopeptide (TPR) repeat protein
MNFRMNVFPLMFLLVSVYISMPAFAQKNKKGKEIAELPTESKQDIEALFIGALQEKITGNHKTALALFAGFVKKHPEIAAGHYEFGELSALNGIYSQALPAYLRAVELEPGNKWYRVSLAEMYDFLKMYKEARETYKKLADLYPKELEYALSAASILVEEGRLPEAMDLLEKVEQEIGITKEINLEKYRLYMAMKKYQEALRELDKLQSVYPEETLFSGMAAEVYYAKGDKKKALEMLELIVKNDPDNTLIHLSLADFYRKERDPAKSFFHLERAFENPEVEMDKKMMILLDLLEEVKNSEEYASQTETLTRILTEVHPEDPKSWSIRGDFFLQRKQWREALASFKKVLALENAKFIFFRQCFQLARRIEDYALLSRLTAEAEDLFPVQPEISLYKGLALTKQGKTEEASETLSYGKEMVIDNPQLTAEFYAAIGILSASKGQTAEAENFFEKALSLFPADYLIRADYAAFLLANGQSQKALVQAEESIRLEGEMPEGFLLRGEILQKTGNVREARSAMDQCLKKGGGEIKRALILYAAILSAEGDTKKAGEIIKQAENL